MVKKRRIFTRGIILSLTIIAMLSVSRYTKAEESYIKSSDKAEFSELYDSKEIDSDNKNVSLSKDDKTGGVFISGKTEELAKTKFTIGKEIDFSNKSKYIVFSGMSERKREVSVLLYLDDSSQNFAKINLTKQGRKNVWNVNDNKCVKLSDEIQGKHKVYFRIVDNDGERYNGENLKVLLNYVFFMEGDIPTVEFDIDERITPIAAMNGDSEHQTECYGNMTLNIPDGYKSEYTDKELSTKTYELDYIRGRGNSTWGPDKKPYKLKLEKKADLLGMGAEKHWILLANYYDISMLRNKFTYWLGEAIGLEFTPKCEFVNVVMNGKYLGSYYLCEQVRVSKNRVNIDDLANDDESKAITSGSAITGGYLLSCGSAEDRLFINTEKGMMFTIESPDFEDYTNLEQYNYILNYLNQTESAIFGDEYKDSNGVSYDEYIDVDSAIDYYWVQEFSINGDAFGSGSTYLYKKRNGKLYWGPLWDFDYVAWGATEYNNNIVQGLSLERHQWYSRLFANKEFREKFVERWPHIREKLLEGIKNGGIIDTYSKKQYASQKANYNVNKMYSEENIFEYNHALKDVIDEFDIDNALDIQPDANKVVTYDSEKERFKQWISERIEWIDNNISSIDMYSTGKKFIFKVGSKNYATVEYTQGTEFSMPKEPSKKGYLFAGWYYKQKIDKKIYEYKFETDSIYALTDSETTLYAKWKKKSKTTTPKKIVLKYNDIYLMPYDDYTIEYGLQPFSAIVSKIEWNSSDTNVAVIDDKGVVHVTTEKPAVCTVTAKVKGIKVAKCRVHVVSWDDIQYVRDFHLQKSKMTIKKGKYSKIKLSFVPEKAYNTNVIFASSNKTVAQVDATGTVYAKKKGTATIIVVGPSLEKVRLCKIKVN